MINETYPSKLLEQAVQELSRLPGVGRKTALRFALFLLNRPTDEVHALSQSLTALRDDVKHCRVCHNIADTDVCDICGDKLVIRSDDQAEVVRHRLETYHEQTEPLKGYYEAQGKLKSIDGAQGITATEKFAVEALGL